jgi:DNA modification methylase
VSVTLIRGDARALPLADASVDLIVTSPPYWALRSYTDGGEHYAGQIGAEPTPAEYVASLVDCTREWMRVLKPSGSLWVNLGDKYAGNVGTTSGHRGIRNVELHGWSRRRQHGFDQSFTPQPNRSGTRSKSLLLLPERYRIACVDQLGLIARAVVIWDKPSGMPESATDRVRRSHEDWVHLTKEPRYFAAIDAVREVSSGYIRKPGAARATPPGVKRRTMTDTCNPAGRLPGSVRSVAAQPLIAPAELGVDHFAAFPMEWPRWITQGWSPAGGVVLDPFGGTGTTALVAHALGRHGVSVDRSADYCRLAAWRTSDPGQYAAALGVDKPRPERTGQLDLFAAGAS